MITIIGFACLANLVADFNEQFDRLPMKPFKCSMCMGFWLSVVPFIITDGWQGILLAAITGITSETIYRLINKI